MKKNVQRLLTISILTSMTGAGIFAINKLINASAVIRNALHNKSQYQDRMFSGLLHKHDENHSMPQSDLPHRSYGKRLLHNSPTA